MRSKISEVSTDGDARRRALDRLLVDPAFERGGRLRDFLTYVVDEEIAGRGDAIRAKTIAQDVYGRDPADNSDPENVVRVDARRLRQQLELYYERAGRSDPFRIHLDPGGYRPRFEEIEIPEVPRQSSVLRSVAVPAGVFASGAAVGAALSLLLTTNAPEPTNTAEVAGSRHDSLRVLRRAAIFEKSAASLQAVNLAEQAREMIFPIFDRPLQELVLTVFQRVIELDPDYFGGYAGAAQILGALGVTIPPGVDRERYLELAQDMANEALRLEPSGAWTQSALSWVAFGRGDYDRALSLSRRASELDPDDGHVLDFHGAVALFAGEFEEALRIADRTKLQGGSNQRFANRNIAGAANFHLGNYREAFETFEEATRFGDPLSAPSLAYEAAALAAMGRTRDAEAKVAELTRAWPGTPVDQMLTSIYRDDAHAMDVIDRIVALGWQSPSSEQ
ncbi:hypothetical protein M1105_20090 [Limibaculum sp. FT325]|uniref:tetratricopeptide repeat protein n=1 Tax=Thermohalobaculum sediminis TaxID=2939436 RepID=UPI0020C10E26|nr:hypothetical protein [Limibaculum sediminis]MCL5779262.1 hypothetical protein [Limibaculum sediminis]